MTQPTNSFSSIGVISGRDLIGDALIKLPFLRALRAAYPKARIHWITAIGPSAYGGILRANTANLIDEVHMMPPWVELQDMRNPTPHATPLVPAPYFDLLIDTRNRWRLALQACKIPHGVFLAMAMRYLFSDRRPPFFAPVPQHLCDRLLQYIELAAGYIPNSTGSLPVPEELLQKARQILPDGHTYVGLAPGCSMASRMWPRYRFEQLARLQADKNHVPVFILGPLELDWYDELKSAIPEAIFPLQATDVWGTPSLSLDHTLAVGTRLNVLVGNDSGPGHIMAAVDCPVVSLFGPTRPAKAAPRTSRGLSLRAQQFGGGSRMDAIPVDAVDHAVERVLRT